MHADALDGAEERIGVGIGVVADLRALGSRATELAGAGSGSVASMDLVR
jgi:hypothetical protein